MIRGGDGKLKGKRNRRRGVVSDAKLLADFAAYQRSQASSKPFPIWWRNR